MGSEEGMKNPRSWIVRFYSYPVIVSEMGDPLFLFGDKNTLGILRDINLKRLKLFTRRTAQVNFQFFRIKLRQKNGQPGGAAHVVGGG